MRFWPSETPPFRESVSARLSDAANHGRTVLFVSHNMLAVEALCTRAICLARRESRTGRGAGRGHFPLYAGTGCQSLRKSFHDDIETAPGNHLIRSHKVCVRPQNGNPAERLRFGLLW